MFPLLLVLAGLLMLALILLASAAPAVLRLAVAVVAALVLAAVPAHAADFDLAGVAASAVGAILVPIASAVAGIVLLVAGKALWQAINRGLDIFERKTGIEVDAAHRAALHSALDTGVHLALQRGAPVVEAAVAAWVKRSVPEAIGHFRLSDEMLDGLVDAKVRKAAVAAPLALPGAILAGLAGGAPLDPAGAA